MTFADMISPGGYKLGEVASALQKSIRRGQEPDALFWATELDLAGFGEYAWKRLRIITSEDVGLAEPGLPTQIAALYLNWSEQREKKDERHGPERLFLVHAVCLLARARKSRMVDHALIWAYEAREKLHPQIPDEARDKHTQAGRMMRRGHQHFWNEGAKIENPGEVSDPYYETARETRVDRPRDEPGSNRPQSPQGDLL